MVQEGQGVAARGEINGGKTTGTGTGAGAGAGTDGWDCSGKTKRSGKEKRGWQGQKRGFITVDVAPTDADADGTE